ncbi:MAG: hypothetical protein DRI77_02905 [Chloroflexi bacterium]|nr:MAG: hypothetical protein DRI77_02905 [Chloroflexota bacterium]
MIPPRNLTNKLHRLWRSVPLRLFVVFIAIYALTAGVSLNRHSLAPHFVYLAESFLHGRLDLIHAPAPSYDLTLFEGSWYVSFPPLPALLMLPLVALRGLAISDVAFSVVMGALNVSLFYVVLKRLGLGARASRAPTFGVWLCVLLGLGTPLWYCAALGSVWYTAHVVAVTCLCFYALEALGKNRPLWTGLWLGLGFLSRAPVLLAFPLTLVLGWRETRNSAVWKPPLWENVRFLLLLALGMAPALLGQAAYNWARFGNPLEFGYRWMNSPGPLLARQATWGQFSLHFVAENLYTMLIRPPLVSLTPLSIEPNPWGMGLLFTCPAILLTLPALAKIRETRFLGLWLSIALVSLPSLLYFNTGSYQFGYRFALDWLPLGILLIALETDGKLHWWGKTLIVASVMMHLWGLLWMYPNFNGQPWHIQHIELLRCLLH